MYLTNNKSILSIFFLALISLAFSSCGKEGNSNLGQISFIVDGNPISYEDDDIVFRRHSPGRMEITSFAGELYPIVNIDYSDDAEVGIKYDLSKPFNGIFGTLLETPSEAYISSFGPEDSGELEFTSITADRVIGTFFFVGKEEVTETETRTITNGTFNVPLHQ